MTAALDYTEYVNKPFGKLVVQPFLRKEGEVLFVCKCACGGTKLALASNIIKGATTSCGCAFKQMMEERSAGVSYKNGDPTGSELNGWRVKKFSRKTANNMKYFILECLDCGHEQEGRYNHLKNNEVRCKGCKVQFNNPYRSNQEVTEEDRRHPLWDRWLCIIDRCYRESSSNYQYYGAKGVRIEDVWLEPKTGYKNFYNWAITNYPNVVELLESGYQLDRTDSFGNYGPGNCGFITNKENQRKKRATRMAIYQGVAVSVKDLAEQHSVVDYYALLHRLKTGWPTELALKAEKGMILKDAKRKYRRANLVECLVD